MAEARRPFPPKAPGRRPDDGRPALSVGFVLTHAFTLTAFATFVDALRLAADDGDGSRPLRCRWTVLGTAPVKASCGVEVAPWERPPAPERFDYLVVVGGLLHAGRQVDEATAAYLRAAAARGVALIGVCTGGFALARAGLMNGRRCCISWYHHGDFVAAFPDLVPVADRLFVVDGDRITCSGGAGVADLAAYLIERHLGRAAAQKALHILQIDRARPADQAQPQTPLAETAAGAPAGGGRVGRALLLMEQNLSDPLPVEAIAKRLNVSLRQLERLFHAATGEGPTAFYRRLRLRHGDWLLRHSVRPITAIASECGFADGAHFSRAFRKTFGASPSAVRRAAGGTGPSHAAPPDRRVFV